MEKQKKVLTDIRFPEHSLNAKEEVKTPIESVEPVILISAPIEPIEPVKPKRLPREIISISEIRPAPKNIEIQSNSIPVRPSRRFHIFGFAALGLIALVMLISAVGFWDLKKTVAESAPHIYEQFKDGGDALLRFEIDNAKSSFAGIKNDLSVLESRANQYAFFSLADLWGTMIPKFKLIPEAFRDIQRLSEEMIQFTINLESLKNNGVPQFLGQSGELMLETLSKLHGNVTNILTASNSLKAYAEGLDTSFSKEFLNINVNLTEADRFLKAVRTWLENPREKRVLLLFQNPSELRPSGGFLGSYGELTVTPRGIEKLKVWDIYDPDGQLDIAIIPPYELQTLVSKWGARDANWFFDFPTSAQKVMSMLETSKIYREQLITFDGVLAINVHVIQSLIELVGPIELPEYNLTIHGENFLTEIQREVEAGDDKKAGEPKRILKVLAPILFERLATLSESQKAILFKALDHHAKSKNIMAYFKDFELQNFLEKNELSGKVFANSQSTNGDYLAVVNTNVAGGKTDIVMNQHIKLSSKIDEEGRIDNFLVIEKKHEGNLKKDPWYRKSNQSYIKVFTSPESRLTFVKGNDKKIIKPALDYAKTNFLTDPDLMAIESTRVHDKILNADTLKESGKTVFGVWQIIDPGETETLELHYYNTQRITLGGDKIPYEFVFEKQSGNKTTLDILLEAPEGYVWKETGNSYFNYTHDTPPGRIRILLTLVPIQTAEQLQP